MSVALDPIGDTQDRRVKRSRAALLAAFNRLFLNQAYATLTLAEVATAADVGRSTAYSHFRSLDDLLAQSMIPVLAPLAETCVEAAPTPALDGVVAHFWDNRRLAQKLLAGESYPVVLRCLAERLEAVLIGSGARLELSAALLAKQIAAAELALLAGWLTGRSGHDAAEIARALHASSRAVVVALTRA